MADFRIDRIRFTWKGVWSAATSYNKDDIVSYGGKVFVSLTAHVSLSDFNDDLDQVISGIAAPRWEQVADGIYWKGDWTVTTFYKVNDLVKHRGILYTCIDSHTSTATTTLGLEADQAKWAMFARTQNWLNLWSELTDYKINDVVKYNGTLYICLVNHTSATTLLGLEDDQSNWAVLNRSDFWRDNWANSIRYQVDDIVRFGGNVYRCVITHISNDSLEVGIGTDLGEDSSVAKWELVVEGIEYRGEFATATPYKTNDIVRYGENLWKAKRGMSGPKSFNDEDDWEIWLPGFGFENAWLETEIYQRGDIVTLGGYTYTALKNNVGERPDVAYLAQNSGSWEVLVRGYNHRGEWDPLTSYEPGDVVRKRGYLYEARKAVDLQILNEPGTVSDENETWRLVKTGIYWKGEWQEATLDDDSSFFEYYPGDVVMDNSITYICKQQHFSNISGSRPKDNTRPGSGGNEFWTIYGGSNPTSTENNALRFRGDIRTFDVSSDGSTLGATNLLIGPASTALKVGETSSLFWEELGASPKVYYVSPKGSDIPQNGTNARNPFKTVKYACEFIAEDTATRAPATVLIQTGIYKEILPISIPRDVALVGDELRSTVIMPESGYELSNMFYARNGSGIRNMTLQGLNGELEAPNVYLTKRPSAGAYVSLDPGEGPDDESVWIINKSPYVQNVSTFGTGCIGLKVDGAVHTGGNKSIVANDFTQILSDGIGYWVKNDGLSELVSVFTYYCHIGYLAEDGGKIRATNGNNSYGTYGSVAEGYNLIEEPIIASVNNRTLPAQIYQVYGDQNKVYGVGYSNAGQSYSSASLSVAGNGTGFSSTYNEFRNSAISEILSTEEDSNFIGGTNYTFKSNNAQIGNTTQITLSGADDSPDNETYVGMRIFITAGKGAGQYAKINTFNTIGKVATVSKESNGEPGWEHVTGYPISAVLDETTKYTIEPRVDIPSPQYMESQASLQGTALSIASNKSNIVVVTSSTADTVYYSNDGGNSFSTILVPGSSSVYTSVSYANGVFVAVAANTNFVAYSNDGTTWQTANIGTTDVWQGLAGNVASNDWVAVGTSNFSKSTNGGSIWNSSSMPAGNWGPAAHGNGTYVALTVDSDVAAYSTDGTSWATTLLPASANWTTVIFGKDRFVALSSKSDSSRVDVAVSFDGITWYPETVETGEYNNIAYNQGLFITLSPNTDIILSSRDGFAWTSSVTNSSGSWSGIAGVNDTTFVGIQSGSNNAVKIQYGATAVARAVIGSGRIGTFVITNPGSNYSAGSPPEVFVFDTKNSSDVTTRTIISSGVLPQPSVLNFGTGYLRTTASITAGDGFADIYQTFDTIILSELPYIPGPGDNISIAGINDVTYFVVKILEETPTDQTFTAKIQISPGLGRQEAPEHGTSVTIRQQYSQVRLTGHDFLDIGTGGFTDTNYPGLYTFGYQSVNEPQQFNEVAQSNGGRVFYTSTDQDGNFRVGELFEVEQSTGTISINASFFELQGLEELSLGGVVLGGTGAVIREFSTDGTFAANSNEIVPTQKAIAKYVQSRVSSGGSDIKVNRLNAGNISIEGQKIFTPLNGRITTKNVMNAQGGITGDMVAYALFASGGSFSPGDSE
jgi:hypothetical protein